MTCDMVCWRWCALELRIARLQPSEDTFEVHSGPAGVGRASRMACTGERTAVPYSLARRPWSRHRKMASVKKRRLWPSLHGLQGRAAHQHFSTARCRRGLFFFLYTPTTSVGLMNCDWRPDAFAV